MRASPVSSFLVAAPRSAAHGRSGRPGPPIPLAARTARRTASARTSAPSAPISVVVALRPLAPVARAKTTSPSPMVWTGLMLRARPSCAICATLLASALVSTASVATTAIVVAAPAALLGSSRAGNSPRLSARIVPTSFLPSAVRAPATTRPVRGSTTSPIALTATSAATVMPPTSIDAVPMPPFIARPMPNSLPTEAPAPAPTLPSASESLRRRFARGVAGGGIGADARVADPEIEQDRRRNDRHDERRRDAIDGRADRRADAALVEPAHHAARRVEAEGAAAGQHDRVHLVDRVDRIEQLGLARPGRRAAHVDAGDGAVAGDHDRAAGRPARVREVADLEAGDRGQACHGAATLPAVAAPREGVAGLGAARRPAGCRLDALKRTRRRSSACGATPRRSGTACRRRSSRSPSGA